MMALKLAKAMHMHPSTLNLILWLAAIVAAAYFLS